MKQRIVLYPDEGKILTNGKEYAMAVYLAENESADNWREVPLSEYEEAVAEVET